ncbi:MAG: nucleotidyl transferase AbiEii/AbiGii toxin family protein [Candidatus Peregrinibacteria bacterium]
MIPLVELQESASEWGLPLTTVERDYALGWVLWGIGTEPEIMDRWVFKGGTCLKKCFTETWRFSEDLDFSLLPESTMDVEYLNSAIASVLGRVSEQSGIDFSVQPPAFRLRPDGASAEGKLYFRSLTGMSHAPLSIKLDLTTSERIVTEPVRRPIQHAYSDALPGNADVLCYSYPEVFAEKIRAMGERSRPRDLYDIINLYWRHDSALHREEVARVLAEKCRAKSIVLVTHETILRSPFLDELKSEWSNMLKHQLKELPPFDHFFGELSAFFTWLHGRSEERKLPQIRTRESVTTWSPPAGVSHWGGAPIEAIRFAASNRLCVQLGYKGTVRLIEPYALRQTQEGNIILVARKVETGESRAYRIDRIESASVTQRSFTPVYDIEITMSSGITPAPIVPDKRSSSRMRPIKAVNLFTTTQSVRAPRIQTYGPTYIYECTVCGKRFPKKKQSSTLNKHKTKGQDYDCMGRTGWLVETKWK